ncbi:MAG TPA: hypothetical protein VG034_02650, partial [Acidimicrobiia bacterium]|nr:hypothetical protein [Acidimicrobiia bacterium]
ADLLSEPATVTVCHSLIAYRCDYGDGDPLRWSPTLAGLCLLDHFPVKVSLDAPDIALVPDVLAAWVTFAARRKNLPEPALARILEVIDACRADFPAAMGVDADHSLRVSVGWSSTPDDVDAFLAALPEVVSRLRRLR